MELTVKPLQDDEIRSGLATVDLAAMSSLDLTSGEHVRLEGPEGTVRATVWPGGAGDDDEAVVRLSDDQRHSLGVGVDDAVRLRPAPVPEAEALLIGVPARLELTDDLARTIRSHVADCIVEPGDTVATPVGTAAGPERVTVRIVGTKPDSPVSVTRSTALKIRTYDDDSGEQGPTYDDVGGLDDVLGRLRELVELPLCDASPFDVLGVDPPTGVLLHGPPGTGKTLLAEAVANETAGLSFVHLSGPEVVSRYYGDSEDRLRTVFEEARADAPAVIFVDEIDAIAPDRAAASGDVERRIVAQLLTLMDGVDAADDVVVVAATNRPDAVDPALRRGGRFDRELAVPVPDTEGRREILATQVRDVPLGPAVDLDEYAARTHGYVGADLATLVREAAMAAVDRTGAGPGGDRADGTSAPRVTDADLGAALDETEPSVLRESTVEAPGVGWDDVGGLDRAKATLREAVEWPLAHPEVVERAGIDPGGGVLLYGPPGTGKTMLAGAAASESDCNLLSVAGPELLSKWVGESERRVRDLFERARATAPTIVLFDEVDALASGRGGDAGSDVGDRVVGQLLTELDGVEPLDGVVVVATTNRPELVDDALRRPGRLDREVRVGPPDAAARREIFEGHAAASPVADDVDFAALAAETDGYVGADVAAVCRRAATLATREHLAGGDDLVVEASHFERALDAVPPSTGDGPPERHDPSGSGQRSRRDGPGFQ